MNLRGLLNKMKTFFSLPNRNNGLFQQSIYQQWYEKDRQRLVWETGMMQSLFPQISLARLNDGRLAFRGTHDGKNIGVIFPYLYPLEPPQVVLSVDSEQNRSISRLSQRFLWQTNMPAAHIVQQILQQTQSNEASEANSQ